MGQPQQSTCAPWATIADVCAPCDEYDFPADLLEDSLQFASDVLFNLSGRQWPGLCEIDGLRPSAQYRAWDPGPPSARQARTESTRWWPGNAREPWGWCSCNREVNVGCRSLPSVQLLGYPIGDVTEVKIDGEVLDPEFYRVDEYQYLVRLPDSDGNNVGWPCCQHLELADDQPGTWSVSYEYGAAPPIGGVRSCASLGCQLALACRPATVGSCRLPKRVTTITRQNVTLAILDPMSLFKDGMTGLAEVDLWLASLRQARTGEFLFVNPETLSRRARRVDT